MKVSIPVQKTVTETVELPQLPYYSCQYGMIYYIITAEENVIKITPKQITYWGPNDTYYGDYLVQAYQAEQCTKEVFEKAVYITLEGINAVLNPPQGNAVTHTMQDPNLQPASEPTTEQVAAVEQAAQEQAMESAEEGGAEG